MDVFCEYIVKVKKNPAELTISALGIILAVILLGFSLFFLFTPFSSFVLLIDAGVVYGAYILITHFNVEYEYILTNSEMDVDRIVAKMRRKRMLSMDFKTIELCARCDDPNFRHEFEHTASIAKTYDVRGGENQEYFVDYAAGESGKTRILFCPNEKMLESIKKMAPRTVHL